MNTYSRFLARLVFNWTNFVRTVLITAGALWLPFEAYEGLSNSDVAVSFATYASASLVLGAGLFLIDGFLLAGFLSDNARVKAGPTSSIIDVKFGDIFSEEGCYVIGVNDFFCGDVRPERVSPKSIHGIVVSRFWGLNELEWTKDCREQLVKSGYTGDECLPGEHNFPIGTAIHLNRQQQNFIFTALTDTDESYVMTASVSNLVTAIQAALRTARQKCSDERIIMPLLGSGLARVGLSNPMILEVILAATIEETHRQKVANQITIILPFSEYGHINIEAIAKGSQ